MQNSNLEIIPPREIHHPTHPLISIVIPTYNAGKYLKLAVSSVLEQSYTNFELIIVNDASTDGSEKYLDSIDDHRVKIMHHDVNRKLPAALNTGFRAATGTYWTWTSSDNICEVDFLKSMVMLKKEYPESSFVYSDYYVIDDDGEIMRNFKAGMAVKNGIYSGGGYRYSYRKTIRENGGVAAFLYDNMREAVGEYDEDLNGTEDWDYWIRIAEMNPLMAYLPKPLMKYRIHDRSMTNTMKSTRSLRENKMMKKRLDAVGGNRLSIHSMFPSLRVLHYKPMDAAYHQAAVELAAGLYTKSMAVKMINQVESPFIETLLTKAAIYATLHDWENVIKTTRVIRARGNWQPYQFRLESLETWNQTTRKGHPKMNSIQLDHHLMHSEHLIEKAYTLKRHKRKSLAIILDAARSEKYMVEDLKKIFDPHGIFSYLYFFMPVNAKIEKFEKYEFAYVYHDATELSDMIHHNDISLIVSFDSTICRLLPGETVPIALVLENEKPPQQCLDLVTHFYVNEWVKPSHTIDQRRILSLHPDHFEYETVRHVGVDKRDFMYVYQQVSPDFDEKFIEYLNLHGNQRGYLVHFDPHVDLSRFSYSSNLEIRLIEISSLKQYLGRVDIVFWMMSTLDETNVRIMQVILNENAILITKQNEWSRRYVEHDITAIMYVSKPPDLHLIVSQATKAKKHLKRNLKTFANHFVAKEVHLSLLYRMTMASKLESRSS